MKFNDDDDDDDDDEEGGEEEEEEETVCSSSTKKRSRPASLMGLSRIYLILEVKKRGSSWEKSE